MSGAEIVDRRAVHPRRSSFIDYFASARKVLHDHILGNLEPEQLRGKADGIEGCRRLGRQPAVLDWLSVTGQSVLEVTAGRCSPTGPAPLAAVRTLLAWYPPDVERYVLAAGWQRLCQSLPMVGRTAEAGDELGSRLLSAGLAGDLLWLAFTLSRRWAPYAKWRGTAFRSSVAASIGPLDAATAAPMAETRERPACGGSLRASSANQGGQRAEPAVIP